MVTKRFGSAKPKGFVNNVRVVCQKCKNAQFIRCGNAAWRCLYCNKMNGAR